ncbi:DUF2934 domain-containing protein [Acidovorax sp. IB03]|nr:DUF2934 domain-containing protein [Acidovorax sp. IB03]
MLARTRIRKAAHFRWRSAGFLDGQCGQSPC